MDNQHTPSSFFSSIWLGVTSSVAVTTMITIWAEVVPSLKTWLGSTFGHHWIGKSIIAVAVFIFISLIGLLRKKSSNDHQVAHLIRLTIWIVILSAAILFGYFLWHTLVSA